MGIKPKTSKTNLTPGPGQYDNDKNATIKAPPAFSISGKNFTDKPFDTPGPGQYKVAEKVVEGPRPVIGTEPRN
jgi:hypothetical protein